MSEEKEIPFCPMCGSSDVSSDFSVPAAVKIGMFPKKCNHCGHVAMIFPIAQKRNLPKNVKSAKHVKNRNLVDVTYGRGMVAVLKLSILFLIVLAILTYIL